MENVVVFGIVLVVAIAIYEFYHNANFKAKVEADAAEVEAKFDAILDRLEGKTVISTTSK